MQEVKRLNRQNIKTNMIKECIIKDTKQNKSNKSNNNDSLDISKLLETKGIDNILFLEKQIKIE